MIINPQSGSGGIKLLAHNVVALSSANAVTVPVPTSLFVFALYTHNNQDYSCAGIRGSSFGDNYLSATLSADGNQLTLFANFGGNTEYWAFG